MFSGMNNVENISFHEQYAALCGYTEEEIDRYFTPYIQEWAEDKKISYDTLRQDIRTWYNGYRFSESKVKVYNPFSIAKAMKLKKLHDFWFDSGNPAFLIDELKKDRRFIELKSFDPCISKTTQGSLSRFEIGAIPLDALMFQTGYLTIESYDAEEGTFKLNYPNQEVTSAFSKHLLIIFAHLADQAAETLPLELKTALSKGDVEQVINHLRGIFAGIPYQLHAGASEKFYHGILLAAIRGGGVISYGELLTADGRIDMVLELPKFIYVVEVKFNQSAELALAQIEEKRYYEPFLRNNKPIILLGINFGRETGSFEITYAAKRMP
jgi:hypothetical protein